MKDIKTGDVLYLNEEDTTLSGTVAGAYGKNIVLRDLYDIHTGRPAGPYRSVTADRLYKDPESAMRTRPQTRLTVYLSQITDVKSLTIFMAMHDLAEDKDAYTAASMKAANYLGAFAKMA